METFLEGLGTTLKGWRGERRGSFPKVFTEHRAGEGSKSLGTTWGRFRKPGQEMAGRVQLDRGTDGRWLEDSKSSREDVGWWTQRFRLGISLRSVSARSVVWPLPRKAGMADSTATIRQF